MGSRCRARAATGGTVGTATREGGREGGTDGRTEREGGRGREGGREREGGRGRQGGRDGEEGREREGEGDGGRRLAGPNRRLPPPPPPHPCCESWRIVVSEYRAHYLSKRYSALAECTHPSHRARSFWPRSAGSKRSCSAPPSPAAGPAGRTRARPPLSPPRVAAGATRRRATDGRAATRT